MYEIISLAEPERWARAYAKASCKNLYFLQAYAELCRCMGDGDPFLFAYEGRQGPPVCYAFIRRPVRGLPFTTEAGLEGEWYDIITPTFGYGGPLCTEPREEVHRAFRAEFEAYCRGANIVSEFVRFDPVMANHRLWGGMMDIDYDRQTVFIDLTHTEEELFANYHPNHQRNIRKAQKHGLEFRVLETDEARQHLADFYCLYRSTMDRLGALPYFYFSAEYLVRLFRGFGPGALLGAVFLDGKMISAALCIREGSTLIYHLGASDETSRRLGVNVFKFHSIALWARRNGLHVFHLGGGHREGDSLFVFKHRFNPKGTLEFKVGRKVHQPQVYARLVESWKRYHAREPPQRYFPAYRAPAAQGVSNSSDPRVRLSQPSWPRPAFAP
jgi:hypothetical protein